MCLFVLDFAFSPLVVSRLWYKQLYNAFMWVSLPFSLPLLSLSVFPVTLLFIQLSLLADWMRDCFVFFQLFSLLHGSLSFLTPCSILSLPVFWLVPSALVFFVPLCSVFTVTIRLVTMDVSSSSLLSIRASALWWPSVCFILPSSLLAFLLTGFFLVLLLFDLAWISLPLVPCSWLIDWLFVWLFVCCLWFRNPGNGCCVSFPFLSFISFISHLVLFLCACRFFSYSFIIIFLSSRRYPLCFSAFFSFLLFFASFLPPSVLHTFLLGSFHRLSSDCHYRCASVVACIDPCVSVCVCIHFQGDHLILWNYQCEHDRSAPLFHRFSLLLRLFWFFPSSSLLHVSFPPLFLLCCCFLSSLVAVFLVVAFIFWAIDALICFVLIKSVYSIFKSTGGEERAKADISSATASIAAQAMTQSVRPPTGTAPTSV